METSTYAAKLRAAAKLIESTGHLPAPCVWALATSESVKVQWQILRSEDTEQRHTLSAIRRAVGGEWRKDASDDTFSLEQERDGLKLQIVAKREAVCTRRVVGTETVTVPAVEAKPEHTIEREVVEWDCDPILAEMQS